MTAEMECEFPGCGHKTKTFQTLKEALQALEIHDRQVHGEEYVKRGQAGLKDTKSEGNSLVKMEKEKKCPDFIKGQRYEFWEKDFNEWCERDMENSKDPVRIRQGLTKMLQSTENEEVKRYYLDSIMNNESVNGVHAEILNKLRDKFKKNAKIECQEVVKAWKNYKYGDDGSGKALDRLTNLRTMLNRNLKKDKETISPSVNDKILLTQFLMAGEEEGKLDKIDSRKIEEDFEKDKYDWDKARATIRKYKIEKEQIGQIHETGYIGQKSYSKNSDYRSKGNFGDKNSQSKDFNRHGSQSRHGSQNRHGS